MKSTIKKLMLAALLMAFIFSSFYSYAQQNDTTAKKFFIDVHQFEPGKITTEELAGAHAKDLAVEGKYGVQILKYWVDETKGRVFCFASAPDSNALLRTHAEAHGMLPQHIYEVTSGTQTALTGNDDLFLDIHYLGAGVSAKDVATAHSKDLAVEGKYGVNITNYFLDEKEGVVMCLTQAKDSSALIQTHKEAHGLVPAEVFKVKEEK